MNTVPSGSPISENPNELKRYCYILDNEIIEINGQDFIINDLQYPANTISLLSEEELKSIGLFELADNFVLFNEFEDMFVNPKEDWIIDTENKIIKKTYYTKPKNKEDLIKLVVYKVQDKLDSFARERNYDDILSACTYATSSIPKFQQEGQKAVALRDATWARLYELLDEVEAGSRPIPSSFEDIEAELPELTWE